MRKYNIGSNLEEAQFLECQIAIFDKLKKNIYLK